MAGDGGGFELETSFGLVAGERIVGDCWLEENLELKLEIHELLRLSVGVELFFSVGLGVDGGINDVSCE